MTSLQVNNTRRELLAPSKLKCTLPKSLPLPRAYSLGQSAGYRPLDLHRTRCVAGAPGYSTLDLNPTALADVLPMFVGSDVMALAAASTSRRARALQPLPGEAAKPSD